jgi:hypothetical protein
MTFACHGIVVVTTKSWVALDPSVLGLSFPFASIHKDWDACGGGEEMGPATFSDIIWLDFSCPLAFTLRKVTSKDSDEAGPCKKSCC